jgi:hypothetical protein
VVIFLRAGSLAWHGIFPGPFGAGAAKITFFGSFELVLACFGFSVLQVRLPAAPAAMMRKLLPCAAACCRVHLDHRWYHFFGSFVNCR